MSIIHYKREVLGILPTSICIEFEKEVDVKDIDSIKDSIESIIFKYLKECDVEVDSFNEYSLDLDLMINLKGILEYFGATREEPAEENIDWNIDYDSLLDKIEEELKANKDYFSVYISKDEYGMDVYPVY